MPAGNAEFSRLWGVRGWGVQQVMLAALRGAVDCAEINLGRKITLSQQVMLKYRGWAQLLSSAGYAEDSGVTQQVMLAGSAEFSMLLSTGGWPSRGCC